MSALIAAPRYRTHIHSSLRPLLPIIAVAATSALHKLTKFADNEGLKLDPRLADFLKVLENVDEN